MTDDHTFTTIRWYNSAPDDHGRCSKIASADVGSYAAIPYGYSHPGEKHATGKPPHPEHGQWQEGIALSKTSRTLVIDVDDFDAYQESALSDWLPPEEATSFRITPGGLKLHFVIVASFKVAAQWPKQGSTPWGDIKSNGFSYITGVHYTGSEYQATGVAPVVADPRLMEAIAAEPRSQASGSSSGAASGAWADPGYAYAEGEKWVRGVADVASMVNQGRTDTDITSIMTAILKRSEGYAGNGEEIPGWIGSARRKYNLTEGQSWAEKMGSETDAALAHLFGADRWARRKVEAAAQALRAAYAPQLAYVQDPAGWAEENPDDDVPDQRWVPLDMKLNPSGVRKEPAGTSDAYHAKEILGASGNVLRYASDSGCWLVNEGHVWSEWGTKSDARDKARSIALSWGKSLTDDRAVNAEAEAELAAAREEWERREQEGELSPEELEDPPSFTLDLAEEGHAERLKRLARNRQRFTSTDGMSAIAGSLLAEAQSSLAYCVQVSWLDAEPHVIWAGGRPWSLLHPELTPAMDADPVHLKNCAVRPVPGPSPLWDEATAALWPDPGVREWAIREIAGAALWGETSKQNPVLDGKPNAGKSTITDTVRKVLGNYAVDVDPDKLIGGRDSSATEEEKAAMIGARMVLLDEPPRRDRQSISQFNRLSSGTGEIAAAAKYKGRVSAPKRFNMIINQNERNRMKLDAEGVRQRLVFIPAAGHIPVELYKRFTAGIRAEYPAILAMLIRECALFHTGHRLPVPVGAQLALDTAVSDGDEFQQWLFENYERPSGPVSKADEDKMHTIDAVRKGFAQHVLSLRGVEALKRPEMRQRLAELDVPVKDTGGTLGKRHNLVLLYPVPEAMSGVPGFR